MWHTLIAFMTLSTPNVAADIVWSGDAHRLICDIAWRHMKPEAKRLATQLRSGESGTFAESCTWADDVKRDRPQTDSYHFINIPKGLRGMNLQRDCRAPRRCMTWAVKHYTQVLADTSQPRSRRAEALKFVAHFVGDVHQPLHAGRPEDRGGNHVYVSFFGDDGSQQRRMQLHSIWDSGILRRGRVRWPNGVEQLNAGISTADVIAWTNSDVVGWTNESYRIAEDFAYSAAPGSNIAEPYYNRALQIATERLQQAGIRLAFLLNEAARGRASFNF
jgi:hypothetical protein